MLAGHLLVFVYNGIVGDLPAVLSPQLRKTLYIFERYISLLRHDLLFRGSWNVYVCDSCAC